ncbi:MAG TPA: alpha/beta hydrolase-fold protein [Chthonomonadaceae bacterium]|nr:alpha/beta hydrolase-fold protein [Chthonomonadaceae bacterium]
MRIEWSILAGLLGLAALMIGNSAEAEDAPLTPKSLNEVLQKRPRGKDADAVADQVRTWFGPDKLLKGQGAKVNGLDIAFAIEAPKAKNVLVKAEGQTVLPASTPLRRIGNTDVFAAYARLNEGDVGKYTYEVDGVKTGGGQYEVYEIRPDRLPNPSVPKGTVTPMPKWHSQIFDHTERDWWIYVPAQYKPENPACVMVFQDGGGYLGSVPTCFDNLIAKGEMPVTIGIFIQPGNLLPGGTPHGNNQRSFEYDTLSDQYSRFLLEEILPEVEKTYKLRHDAGSRAIAGLSSGAICAFTVAWQRPNEFSKVLSWIGSYTDLAGGATGIEGGHNYPFMIRRQEKKPIRIFLQDGDNDLDNPFGNWPLCNQQMAKAFAFKGYDYQFVFGHGGHSGTHGTAILPDSLRWLWRDYKP